MQALLFHLGIAPRQAAVDTAMQEPAGAKLQMPILNVGLPQSGSQEVLDFFGCGGMKTSHYKCEANCSGERAGLDSCKMPVMKNYCGSCVTDNVKAGSPPLTGCGDYDVWAKLDGPWLALDAPAADCMLPQIRSLDAIHEAYPHATLVLPLFPAAKWVQMVTSGNETHGTLRQNLRKCNLADTDYPCTADCVDDDEKFAAFYDAHSQAIRNWVEKYPTHELIEINLEGEDAGTQLAGATGIKATCWPEKKIEVPAADKTAALDYGKPQQQQQQQPQQQQRQQQQQQQQHTSLGSEVTDVMDAFSQMELCACATWRNVVACMAVRFTADRLAGAALVARKQPRATIGVAILYGIQGPIAYGALSRR